jgi:hypothetical protein
MPESTSSPVRDLGFGLQRDPSRDLNLLCTRHYFLFIMFIPRLKASVVDRHRFDSDPDPDFQVDADPDPDGHQNDADPSKFYKCWKIRKNFLLEFTVLPV